MSLGRAVHSGHDTMNSEIKARKLIKLLFGHPEMLAHTVRKPRPHGKSVSRFSGRPVQ